MTQRDHVEPRMCVSLGPRAKLWLALAVMMGALLIDHPLAVALLGCAALPQLLASRSGRHALAARFRALLPLMAAVLAAQWLSAAISGVAAGHFGRDRALLLGARVAAVTIWSSWLTHDLSLSELDAALRACGLPDAFVSLLFATRRYGRQLTSTLQAAWAACALRGGLHSLSALRHTIGAVAGVVLVRSLDRSERVAIAQALRGSNADDRAPSREAP